MINLKKSLYSFVDIFQNHSINVVLIGGLACGVWKHMRATKDIDFLIDERDYEKTIQLMKNLGYRRCVEYDKLGILKLPEVLEKDLPEIDFVIANRKFLKEILASSQEAEFGDKKIKIANPEQLIILKLKAIHDNPDRELDFYDIINLIRYNKDLINLTRLEKFLDYFQLKDKKDEIRQRFDRI